MKIVNPYKDKDIPKLIADEPFMLWCPKRDIYYRTVIVKWYGGLVLRDTQLAKDKLFFTIARLNATGSDMYRTTEEIIEVLQTKNYWFSFKNVGLR